MAGIENKLKELGLTLPQAAPAVYIYVPYVISGKSLYIAGQIPFLNGEKMHQGRLGENMGIDEGKKAAEACALNILSQVDAAVGGEWDKVVRCVKVGGFVNCIPAFDQMSMVINGASDLLVAVLGERGKHARFAVGVANLPLGVAVEIDAIFELA